MPVSLNLSKFAVAAVIATPLVLVACGSGDDVEEQAASASTVTSQATAASTTQTSSTTSASTSASESAEGETPSAAADQPSGSAADGGAAPVLENPFENGDIEVAQPDPVQGRPASAEETEALSNLVNGIYQQPSLHGFMMYMPNHTCAATLEAQGGIEAYSLDGIPDMPMNQFPGYSESRVTAIENQTVTDSGDRASATVTVQSAEGPSTGTMVFQHEGGEWKFCS
ncbi:hypothetical protein [Corynebacterium doosanense]|uniref:hypothetical protein n=1 Tax=Corynebacterium doosanense TaxID=1121358 RepID=UPI00039FC2E6|nr:hypothetical protein [Corynebacterium doosanense]